MGGRLVVIQRQGGESRRDVLARAWHIAASVSAVSGVSHDPLAIDTAARMAAAVQVLGCQFGTPRPELGRLENVADRPLGLMEQVADRLQH